MTWEVHVDSPTGATASMGTVPVNVPLGSIASQAITIHTPTVGTTCYVLLRAQKSGSAVFEDTAQSFTLTNKKPMPSAGGGPDVDVEAQSVQTCVSSVVCRASRQ